MLTCIVNLFGVLTCVALVNPSAKIIHVEPFEVATPARDAPVETGIPPDDWPTPLPRPRPKGLGEYVAPLDKPRTVIQQ